MSGEGVRIDASEVTALLNRLQRELSPEGMDDVLAAVGQAVVTATDLGFRAEEDPWGQPWQPLSEYTLEQRRKGDGVVRILRDTGNLANSINYQVDQGKAVAIGTGVTYASTHQYGEGGIPRRAFLPIDPYGNADLPGTLRDDLLDILQLHVDRAIGARS